VDTVFARTIQIRRCATMTFLAVRYCVCRCGLVRDLLRRAVQTRSFHASAARQFDFSKFSNAVTSNEAR